MNSNEIIFSQICDKYSLPSPRKSTEENAQYQVGKVGLTQVAKDIEWLINRVKELESYVDSYENTP